MFRRGVSVVAVVVALLLLATAIGLPVRGQPAVQPPDGDALDTGPTLLTRKVPWPDDLRANTPAAQSALAVAQWRTILSEEFDGAEPPADWMAFDNDEATHGEYFWAITDCYDHGSSGDSDVVPHAGGADAAYTCWKSYPPNMDSWLVYGPFSLEGATEAVLTYDLALDSERSRDALLVGLSKDGQTFPVEDAYSGTLAGWWGMELDLSALPRSGNICGEPELWLAFVFQSDGEGESHTGPWLDNVEIRVFGEPVPATVTPTAGSSVYLPLVMRR